MNPIQLFDASMLEFKSCLSKPQINAETLDRCVAKVRSAATVVHESNVGRECPSEQVGNLLHSIEELIETTKSKLKLKQDKPDRLNFIRALISLNSTADALNQGLFDKCKALMTEKKFLDALEDSDMIHDLRKRYEIEKDFALALYEKKPSEALLLADGILDPEIKMSTFVALCEICLAKGDLPDAERIASRITDPKLKSTILVRCFFAYLKDGKTDEANSCVIDLKLKDLLLALLEVLKTMPYDIVLREKIIRTRALCTEHGEDKTTAEIILKAAEATRENILKTLNNCNNNYLHLSIQEARDIPVLSIRYETLKAIYEHQKTGPQQSPPLMDDSPESLLKRAAHAMNIGDTTPGAQIYESFVTTNANWPIQIVKLMTDLPPDLNQRFSVEQKNALVEGFMIANHNLKNLYLDIIAQSIREGELAILNTGYYGHATSMTFYQGYCVLSDRSQAGKSIFFKLDNTSVTKEMIQELNWVTQHFDKESQEKYFAESWHRGRQVQNPLDLPPQTVGNCTYACMEEALLAALFFLKGEEQSLEEIQTLHRDLMAHFKLLKVEEYLAHASDQLDPYLIDTSLERIDQDPSLKQIIPSFPRLYKLRRSRAEGDAS